MYLGERLADCCGDKNVVMSSLPFVENGLVSSEHDEILRCKPRGQPTTAPDQKEANPGVTLPPCRGLWGTLHIGDDIDCNTCSHPGVPKVESHLFTVGGFLGNSKGMAWKTESMQNMGV